MPKGHKVGHVLVVIFIQQRNQCPQKPIYFSSSREFCCYFINGENFERGFAGVGGYPFGTINKEICVDVLLSKPKNLSFSVVFATLGLQNVEEINKVSRCT